MLPSRDFRLPRLSLNTRHNARPAIRLRFMPAYRVISCAVMLLATCLVSVSAAAQCNTTWIGPASGGDWSNAAYWSSGVPTSSTNVCIDNGNAQHSAVTLDTGGSAANLTIDTDDSLSFNDNKSLTIFGSAITNAGNISLNSGGNNTDLILAGSDTVTLTGGGTVTLGNGSENNRIYSQSNGTLINQETIQGVGQIGVGLTTITNQATIDANVAGVLYISPGSGGVTNTGTLEATNGSRLDLAGGYTNTGGTIKASGSNSVVTLDNNASITGGTLTDTSGGVIESLNSATLNGLTISTGSTYADPDNTSTVLQGTIRNNGNIALNSGGNNTNLILSGNGTVTLTGTGTVTMGNGSENNRIYSASNGTLINQETIQGIGQIGVGQTTITNSGTINANIAGVLTVSPGAGGVANTGTMEATNGSRLDLVGGYTNTGGIISASGTSSLVTLDQASITGGTLTSAGGGTIESVNSATLNGVTLSTGSSYAVPDNTNTILQGTITNKGNIALNSGGNNTDLIMSGNRTVTLTGTGTVTMGNGSENNRIYSQSNGTLVNKQTIQGVGQIGVGQTTITNNGTINANVAGVLTINPGAGGVTNTGTLEATNGSTLTLYNGTFTNTGATIEALNATTASTVVLNAASINGGTLTTTGNGVINDTGGSLLNGVTVSTGSNVIIPDNNATSWEGTITNNGTILDNSGGNNTDIHISGAVTLTGTGTLVFGNNGNNNRLYAPNGTDTFTIKESIQGTGQLGVGLTKMINSKIINADNAGGTLTVQPNSAGFANNGGTLESSNGGILNLIGTFTNSATGKIEALTGSTTQINGTTVKGGTLTTVGIGIIDVFNSSTLNALTISTASNVNMPDISSTTVVGTITDNGTLTLNSGGNNTDFKLSGNVTLVGTGTLTMSNNSNNRIYDPSGTHTLTNGVIIQGSGQIGVGLMGLVNNGTINANSSAGIAVDTNSTGLTNNGTLQVGSGDSMHVFGGPFSNYSSGTLTGGSYISAGTLEIDEIGNTGGEITTDAANITLNGATASFVDAGGHTVLNNLNTITSTGSFTVEGGSNFTTVGNFTNNGRLTVGTGTNFVVNGKLTNFSGTTLTGGTYNVGGKLQFNGANIVTDSANITLTSASAQIVDQTSHNALANLATVSSGAGFGVTGGANFTTAGNFTNNGTLTAGSGSKFVVNGNLTNFSGNTLTRGSYNVGGTLQFNGANIINNAASIDITGASGKIVDQSAHNALAGFAKNTSTGNFTLSGNATFTTAGAFSNAGVLDVSKGSTFILGNKSTYTQTGGKTILDGEMTATTPGNFMFNAGSIFGNGGTFTGALTSAGMFNIGDAPKEAGKLTITGSYTQASAGDLNIDIGGLTVGTLYDQLKVSKTATLGGTLNLNLINTFVPKLGAVFTIMTYGSESGNFATVTGTQINLSEHFQVVYNPTSVQLDVVAGSTSPSSPVEIFGNGTLASNSSPGLAATPEPSTLLLLGGGLLAAAGAFRRKLRSL